MAQRRAWRVLVRRPRFRSGWSAPSSCPGCWHPSWVRCVPPTRALDRSHSLSLSQHCDIWPAAGKAHPSKSLWPTLPHWQVAATLFPGGFPSRRALDLPANLASTRAQAGPASGGAGQGIQQEVPLGGIGLGSMLALGRRVRSCGEYHGEGSSMTPPLAFAASPAPAGAVRREKHVARCPAALPR